MTPTPLKEAVSTTETVISSDGKSVKLTIHDFSGSKDGWAFSVLYNEYPKWVFELTDPKTMSDALLNGAGLGLATMTNGKLLLERKINFGAYPGREVLVETQHGGKKVIAKARYYLVNTRLYQVMVMGASGAGEIEKVDSFLKSFKLIEK